MENIVRIEVKLYGYHDLDLVSIYQTGLLYFPSVTKQLLNSYARKEVYRLRLPPMIKKQKDGYYSTNRRVYHYHVDLEPDQDMDAIRLIETITPGYRNNFIKSIFRQYLCGFFFPDYSINGDISMFEEMSRKFQCCREEVDPVFDRKRREKKTRKKELYIPKIGEEEDRKVKKIKEKRKVKRDEADTLHEDAQEQETEIVPKTSTSDRLPTTDPISDISDLNKSVSESEPEKIGEEDISSVEENQSGEADFFDFLSKTTEQY